MGWLLRVNRLYGPAERWLRSATFADAFQGGCWPERTSLYQISRWETAAVRVPYLAIRRYEELLDLPSHMLVAHVDTIYRYSGSGGEADPQLARPADRAGAPDRLGELVDRAGSTTAMLTGADWDELTQRLAAAPAIVLAPHRAWSDIAGRLLTETLVADGIAWMRRYEALSRLLAHPAGQQAAVAACAALAGDRTNQVFVETVSALDASGHPDANRHVLRQLTDPTNDRAQYGALLASIRKVRFRHFTDEEMPHLVAALHEMTFDSALRHHLRPLAVEVSRQLPVTQSAADRAWLRRIAGDPALGPVLTAGRLADGVASRRVVDRIANAVIAAMPREPGTFRDDVLLTLLDEMLFSPVFDVRLQAAMAVAGTPYRSRLAARLAAELAAPEVLRTAVAPTMIEGLRLLGGHLQRATIERLITATGLPTPVTLAAAQAIGHVGGSSDDEFWRTAIGHHGGHWQRTRHPIAEAALNSLTYGLGMNRNRTMLQALRADRQVPDQVRTAATWWCNLPDTLYRSANL